MRRPSESNWLVSTYKKSIWIQYDEHQMILVSVKCNYMGNYMFIGFSLHDQDRKVFSISATAMHISCVIDAFIITVLPQEMMGN